MKTTAYLLILLNFSLFLMHPLPAQAQSGNPCGVANPIQDLPFLNNLATQLCEPFSCVSQILVGWYNGEYVFFTSINFMCADFPVEVYDCSGNQLCTIGGFIGGTGNCPNFFETVTNVQVLADTGSFCGQDNCTDNALLNTLSCFDVYASVCGCNGVTYSNGCYAANAGITSYTDGACGAIPDCYNPQQVGIGPCPLIYAPVCGCNGVTYGNACEAAYSGITVFVPGECGSVAYPPCVNPMLVNNNPCPPTYEPVCGCNGVSYANACYATREGVTSYTSGECNTATYTICPGEAAFIGVPEEPGFAYFWSPWAGVSCPNCASTSINIAQSATFTLNIIPISGGVPVVKYFRVEIDPCIPNFDYAICAGESVAIGSPFVPNTLYTWSPTAGLSCTNCPNPLASPVATTTYTLTTYTTFGGGPFYETHTVTVQNCNPIDTIYHTICLGDGILLYPTGVFIPETSFTFSPGTGLSCTDCVETFASPTETTTYTLTATDWFTGQSYVANIFVVTVEICEGIKPSVNMLPLKVFPNPIKNNESLSIQLPAPDVGFMTISVLDLYGKAVFSDNILNQNAVLIVKTSNLPTGLYFVQVQSGGRLYGAKFLKH